MNNDFWVTSEAICQWFSRVTLVKIICKSPHSWPKNHGNSCIILYVFHEEEFQLNVLWTEIYQYFHVVGDEKLAKSNNFHSIKQTSKCLGLNVSMLIFVTNISLYGWVKTFSYCIILIFWGNMQIYMNFFSFYKLNWYKKSVPIEENSKFILHNQHHGCWWPGDRRSQGICIHGTDLVLPGIFHSQHAPERLQFQPCMRDDKMFQNWHMSIRKTNPSNFPTV